MSVVVSVCHADLENGVSKTAPEPHHSDGNVSKLSFLFCFSLVRLKDCAQQTFKGIAFNPTRYKNLYE